MLLVDGLLPPYVRSSHLGERAPLLVYVALPTGLVFSLNVCDWKMLLCKCSLLKQVECEDF